MKKISKNFLQRLLFSAIEIILLLTALYLSKDGIFKISFTVLAAGLIGTALWEFYQMVKVKACQPLTKIGIGGTILYVFAVYLSTQYAFAKSLPETVLALTLLSAFMYYFFKGADPFVNLAVTLFGIFYLTLPLACAVYIIYFFPEGSSQDGRWWLFYLIAVTKMTDIGGYFIGKLFGSKKLAPYISPGKTWEGAVGGIVCALAASLAFYFLLPYYFTPSPIELTLAKSLGLGLLISLLAQFGDLAESILKRDLGFKDSSRLPGIGGILDILDSLVFTVPLIYLFLRFTYA